MTESIVCIVEGHGDAGALPVLVRRVLEQAAPQRHFLVPKPIRVTKSKLVKAGELEKAVELAARTGMDRGRILIVIDSDDDCPANLGPQLLARAHAARADRTIGVVIAKHEFEAWFLASAVSLRGCRDLPVDLEAPLLPESYRDAKGWLSSAMPEGKSYRETIDQPALAAKMDIQVARSSDSFDKFCRVIDSFLV